MSQWICGCHFYFHFVLWTLDLKLNLSFLPICLVESFQVYLIRIWNVHNHYITVEIVIEICLVDPDELLKRLLWVLIPPSLMSKLVCIAALNVSSAAAAAGPIERVKSTLCVWLTAEWNRMQRLHCQPAGVSANRWGNAGAGTPKLGLPWKRFASWSPAISLQLFSFHDRSTRA